MSALPRLVPSPSTDRDAARHELRVYMSRTGMGLSQIAELIGLAHTSMRQFISAAKYGDGEGALTSRKILDFLQANPPARLERPGKLYETDCTRAIRSMVNYVGSGRWGILYGPAGSQKSFGLESIAAETADDPEPRAVYLECSPRLTPSGLMRRVATVLGAPYAQCREGLLQSLLFLIRRRRHPLALLIDEAQHLYRAVDTLETIRDLGDKARGKVGILVAGNEDVLRLFEPRRGVYFEQWRSRIEQKTVRLTGLSREESKEIVQAELGTLPAEVVADLCGKPVIDPESKRHYYSARRLFNAIRDFREMRDRARGQG
ncbi:MAG TPA: ATP-binding protein [Terriglobia bacterium]|nr:ATP-binding protein [Terriglobia bacterium]